MELVTSRCYCKGTLWQASLIEELKYTQTHLDYVKDACGVEFDFSGCSKHFYHSAILNALVHVCFLACVLLDYWKFEIHIAVTIGFKQGILLVAVSRYYTLFTIILFTRENIAMRYSLHFKFLTDVFLFFCVTVSCINTVTRSSRKLKQKCSEMSTTLQQWKNSWIYWGWEWNWKDLTGELCMQNG